jgi:hypothetical protein
MILLPFFCIAFRSRERPSLFSGLTPATVRTSAKVSVAEVIEELVLVKVHSESTVNNGVSAEEHTVKDKGVVCVYLGLVDSLEAEHLDSIRQFVVCLEVPQSRLS